jgi:hypothetical protein
MAQCLAANEINSVAGILNGTTNYILNKMIVDNMDFDTALKLAQDLGFAERNPAADVEGHDACRKICILAALGFGKHVYPDQVKTEGITNISLDDVEYAIFESNGKLSTMEKSNRQSVPTSLPILIVSEGKISKENIKVVGKKTEQIFTYLKARNLSLKNVEVMTVDGNGRAYIQVKKTPYFIDYFPLTEGVRW